MVVRKRKAGEKLAKCCGCLGPVKWTEYNDNDHYCAPCAGRADQEFIFPPVDQKKENDRR
jgi:hypothetical protein